jgi:CRISPR-associated endonuclease/helicase Cas3
MGHLIMKSLLAKTYDTQRYSEPPISALLTGHISDVAEAGKTLFDIAGNIALENAGLNNGYVSRFQEALTLYAWMHDEGKANSHFNDMLAAAQEGNHLPQLVYHEVVSALLFFSHLPLRNWLQKLGPVYFDALIAVAGHHRRFDINTTPKQSASMKVYSAHTDFKTLLGNIADAMGGKLPPPPLVSKNMHLDHDTALLGIRRLIEAFTLKEPDYTNHKDRVYISLLKAFGIAADVAASAIGRKFGHGYSVSRYIYQIFREGLGEDDISKVINRWAWKKCSTSKRVHSHALPYGFKFRPFQLAVPKSESTLTLVKAGCGSGKSVAAYLWAREWIRRRQRKTRVFFCLPTTGTTTEHYKDYGLHLGLKSSLSHCRRQMDLQLMARQAPDDDNPAAELLKAELDKIESLNLWSTPFTVCTVDTILGLMTYQMRSLCTLPAIMDSVLVFDEVHSYDKSLFGNLLSFLKAFPKLPVLLMTASLSVSRVNAIKAARPDLNLVAGDEEYDNLKRYILREQKVGDTCHWDTIEKTLLQKGKILWVRNTVDRAINTYVECRKRFPQAKVYLYHSRYKYKNRLWIHRQVMDTFNAPGVPVILVATQVAEMSLDLSADLLLTDIAPIWAMIQRLGRLNRRSTPESPKPPATAIVMDLKDGQEKPYSIGEFEEGRIWTWSNANKVVSQSELIADFEALCEPEDIHHSICDREAVFIHGIWRTRPGATRAPSYTVGVVLQEDLDKCDQRYRNGRPKSSWLRRHEINIPFRNEIFGWKKLGSLFIAPPWSVQYSRTLGARWIVGSK